MQNCGDMLEISYKHTSNIQPNISFPYCQETSAKKQKLIHTDLYANVCTSFIFIVVKNQKQPKWLAGECIIWPIEQKETNYQFTQYKALQVTLQRIITSDKSQAQDIVTLKIVFIAILGKVRIQNSKPKTSLSWSGVREKRN